MKLKIIMTKGLPASGKSTWAREMVAKGYKRVNKDDLRAMLDNSEWSKGNEHFVLETRNFLITHAIKQGHSIIVDDTNFNPSHEKDLRAMADELLVDFEIKDFTDVPLQVCLDRDAMRPNSVGSKVIIEMYDRYLKPKLPPEVMNDPLFLNAIICDLDGTLAIHNGRSPYDADKCDTDLVNVPILNILLKYQTDYELIFCSGREDKFREKTTDWLKKNGITSPGLLMRPTGDTRNDAIVKQEIYENKIKGKYNVLFVLDDRDRVVKMWREQGLTCLQVAEGDF